MCWNENISLNTFIFTSFILLFIWYNNHYTQYKIKGFAYLAFFSFTSMQLIEYFLWKSIKNKNITQNYIFSLLGWIIIYIFQPLTFILALPTNYETFKYIELVTYFIILFIVIIYKYFYDPIIFKTTVGKNGHLQWYWVFNYSDKLVDILVCLLYFIAIFTTSFIRFPIIALYALFILAYSYIHYSLAWSSIWCWLVNSILLYFLIQILFILPYKEYNKLC